MDLSSVDAVRRSMHREAEDATVQLLHLPLLLVLLCILARCVAGSVTGTAGTADLVAGSVTRTAGTADLVAAGTADLVAATATAAGQVWIDGWRRTPHRLLQPINVCFM